MTRSRRFFASSPWIATGTPDYVNLGYTSRGLAKQALMRLSRKSLAIFRKLGLAVSKASVQLRNEADELDAPRAPSSGRGCGPTRINWGIDAGSDSRSGAGASGEATPQLWSGRRQVRAGGSG